MRSILIVDDDPSFRYILERICSGDGIETVTADTIAAAREALATRTFDLILLDLQIEGERGLSLIADVDADPGLREKTVIVTGFPNISPAFSGLPVVDKRSLADLGVHLRRLVDSAD